MICMKTKLFLVKRKIPDPNFCYTTIPSKFSLSVLYKKALLNDQILYFLKRRVWKACFTVHKPVFDRWATPWPCSAWRIQLWTKMFDCLVPALALRSVTIPRQSSILLCEKWQKVVDENMWEKLNKGACILLCVLNSMIFHLFRVNCSFYFKIGACRHGERCSRLHNKPTFSQVCTF